MYNMDDGDCISDHFDNSFPIPTISNTNSSETNKNFDQGFNNFNQFDNNAFKFPMIQNDGPVNIPPENQETINKNTPDASSSPSSQKQKKKKVNKVKHASSKQDDAKQNIKDINISADKTGINKSNIKSGMRNNTNENKELLIKAKKFMIQKMQFKYDDSSLQHLMGSIKKKSKIVKKQLSQSNISLNKENVAEALLSQVENDKRNDYISVKRNVTLKIENEAPVKHCTLYDSFISDSTEGFQSTQENEILRKLNQDNNNNNNQKSQNKTIPEVKLNTLIQNESQQSENESSFGMNSFKVLTPIKYQDEPNISVTKEKHTKQKKPEIDHIIHGKLSISNISAISPVHPIRQNNLSKEIANSNNHPNEETNKTRNANNDSLDNIVDTLQISEPHDTLHSDSEFDDMLETEETSESHLDPVNQNSNIKTKNEISLNDALNITEEDPLTVSPPTKQLKSNQINSQNNQNAISNEAIEYSSDNSYYSSYYDEETDELSIHSHNSSKKQSTETSKNKIILKNNSKSSSPQKENVSNDKYEYYSDEENNPSVDHSKNSNLKVQSNDLHFHDPNSPQRKTSNSLKLGSNLSTNKHPSPEADESNESMNTENQSTNDYLIQIDSKEIGNNNEIYKSNAKITFQLDPIPEKSSSISNLDKEASINNDKNLNTESNFSKISSEINEKSIQNETFSSTKNSSIIKQANINTSNSPSKQSQSNCFAQKEKMKNQNDESFVKNQMNYLAGKYGMLSKQPQDQKKKSMNESQGLMSSINSKTFKSDSQGSTIYQQMQTKPPQTEFLDIFKAPSHPTKIQKTFAGSSSAGWIDDDEFEFDYDRGPPPPDDFSFDDANYSTEKCLKHDNKSFLNSNNKIINPNFKSSTQITKSASDINPSEENESYFKTNEFESDSIGPPLLSNKKMGDSVISNDGWNL